MEVQSLNHWTPGKFHVDSFCLFYCRVARVFTWGVALLRVLSGADWLHSATEAFPDCLRVFFLLFLGICFSPLWPVEELVFVFRVLWFSQGMSRYGLFPLLLYGCGVSGRLCGPVLEDRGCHPLRRPVLMLPAGLSSAGPMLEASCRLCSFDHLLPAFQSACLRGQLVHSDASLWFRLGHVFC